MIKFMLLRDSKRYKISLIINSLPGIFYNIIVLCRKILERITVLQTSSTTGNPQNEVAQSNCREMLDERLQVQWELKEDYIQIQLAGNIREDQYMAFGLSGENGR